MKTLISVGDFVDIYFKFYSSSLGRIFSRLIPSSYKKRTTKSWDIVINETPGNWWSIPIIQKRWNKLITGMEEEEYPDYIVKKYLNVRNNLTLLSPGCGTGSKELKFTKFNNFKLIDAFDISPNRIATAKESADRMGGKNITFAISDIMSFKFENNKYDIVLFDSSLHHVKELGYILAEVYRCLKDDGILVINEYVGPARFQWSKKQMRVSNEALEVLPSKFKRRWQNNSLKSKIYRPGILRMIISDPSEAVKSQNILPIIYQHFNILEEKPYGGNILHLTLKDISHNFINETDETVQLMKQLIKIEDDFLAKGNKSDFIFGVYSKKQFTN